ncbi:1-acyl-sn-glycerol-3-phosphate acyltransferase [Mucilaginibacter panaciglaebae]|uniref:Phospholipid/glycerol acyltransferase domain-containing protein n=1 Tax=Mucilaginibacter panaciglaebae TaxID=502331 RepID=A0ABP7WVB3_9SPHI
MIYPRKNIVIKTSVELYLRWITARYFSRINFNTIPIDKGKSILLIGNHFSFWDAIVLYHINRIFFKKKFHVMILEETAIKETPLTYLGAFSVNRGSRDIVESLSFASSLLNTPNNLVLIFPQGKLYSNMIEEIPFERGVMNIIKKASNFQLVFAATFIENFNNFKPVANVHLKPESGTGFKDIDALQLAYQQHYMHARQQQLQITK